MPEIKVKVDDMKTLESGEVIKKQVLTLAGVSDATVDLESKIVNVQLNSDGACSPDDVVCSIKSVGYYSVNITNP